jgi:sugar O-acyltransferase (sialic acid O-acetyltransferase NeuD family)
MTTRQDIILVGGGGHCRSCIDVIEATGAYTIKGIVDVAEKVGQSVLGYPIVAADDDLPALVGEGPLFLVTIGQVKTPDPRIRAFERLAALSAGLATVVSPLARVSRHATLGQGTVVMHHAVVNAGARVGANCILNTSCLVEHDAVVADHCHVSTAAVLNGGARIGRGSFLGSNAVTREGMDIGERCVIGCGVRVLKPVPDNRTLKG